MTQRKPLLVCVGDSVMNGARREVAALDGWRVVVDAIGLRNAGRDVVDDRVEGGGTVPSGVTALRAARALEPVAVVLHVGNNGRMEDEHVEALSAEIAALPLVVLLTLREGASWPKPNNERLREIARSAENVRLLDWERASDGRDWVGRDGLHLTYRGRPAYAALIAVTLAEAGGLKPR